MSSLQKLTLQETAVQAANLTNWLVKIGLQDSHNLVAEGVVGAQKAAKV